MTRRIRSRSQVLTEQPVQDTQKPELGRLYIAAFIIIAVSLAVVVVYLLLPWKQLFTIAYCESEACEAHSRALTSSMNMSVNPCDDFHAFVCGRWYGQAGLPSVLATINRKAMQDTLAEVKADLWEEEQTARFFHSCLDPESHADANVELFQDLKRRLSLFWPESDPSDTHPLGAMIAMAVRWDMNPVFRLEVASGTGTGNRMLILRRGNLGVVWEGRREVRESSVEYEQHVQRHLLLLNAPDSFSVDYPTLRNLEIEIVDGVYAASRGEPNQEWYALEKLGNNRDITPLWYEFLNQNFDPRDRWTRDNLVLVEDTRTLDHVERLIGGHASSEVMMGLSWVFIQSHLWAASGQAELMIRDRPSTTKEWACLEYVISRFGLLTSAKHLDVRYATQARRDEVNSYVHLVKDTVISVVDRTAWIDKQFREEALSKLRDMKLHVLPADEFFVRSERNRLYSDFPAMNASFVWNWISTSKNLSIQRNPHYQNLYSKHMAYQHSPSAYLYPLNTVEMAMVALEPPLFYYNTTYAINYAGLGSMLAKEIVKSFDTKGTKVDMTGDFVQWWGAAHSFEYRKRVVCDLHQATGNDSHSGRQQQALFPSIPALEVTLLAFKEAVSLDVRTIGDFKIAGLEQYTDDQIFFISYCYWMCSGTGDVDKNECNVPLRHSSTFARTFNCPEEAPMNPSNKCKFFLD